MRTNEVAKLSAIVNRTQNLASKNATLEGEYRYFLQQTLPLVSVSFFEIENHWAVWDHTALTFAAFPPDPADPTKCWDNRRKPAHA